MNEPYRTEFIDGREWRITPDFSADLLPYPTWCVRFLVSGGPAFTETINVAVSDDGKRLFLSGYDNDGPARSVSKWKAAGDALFPGWEVVEFKRRRPGREEQHVRLINTRNTNPTSPALPALEGE